MKYQVLCSWLKDNWFKYQFSYNFVALARCCCILYCSLWRELEKYYWAHLTPSQTILAQIQKRERQKKVWDRERKTKRKGETGWVGERWEIKTGICRGRNKQSGRDEEKKGWEKKGKDSESGLASHHSITTCSHQKTPARPKSSSRPSRQRTCDSQLCRRWQAG